MKKVWQNKLLKGSFAMILLSVTNVAFGEVSACLLYTSDAADE